MEGLLQNRRVLVTGASGRLGRVVTSAFQQNGASVIGVDADPSSAAAEPCYASDLTVEEAVVDLFERLVSDGRMPNVVIHTVGMWDGQPFAETAFDSWQRTVDVNLTSTFLVFREAIRKHLQTPTDDPLRLIAFGSGQGADRGRGKQAAYSAAKAGVIRLVESIGEEYAERGVTAHAIAPSMILFEGMEEEKGIPAVDLGNLCLLLAGPAADALNGAVVRAYGTLT